MYADDLFTAPQVAKICSTDLKTIHNWVNRGEINYFRTPGRHLRFRRGDILEFLNKFGYPVPVNFRSTRPRVIVIDSVEGSSKEITRVLSEDVDLEIFRDHMDALLAIGKQAPSLVLVNGICDPAMMHVVERIATSESRIPVAVYGGDAEIEKKSREAGAAAWITGIDDKQLRRRAIDLLGAGPAR